MTACRSLLDLRALYGPQFVGSLIVRPRGGHNMGQFLFEVMSIALAGGLGGLTVAVLIVLGVSQVSTEGTTAMEYLLRPVVSWPIVSLSVGTLLLVGLLAGILPTRRSAAVDPVESPRYE